MGKIYLIQSILLALFFGTATAFSASAGGAPPPEVIQVANECMKRFLRPDRFEYLHNAHGFEHQEDLDKAVLGAGFEIYTISPQRLLDESGPQDLQSLVASTNQWSFLILVNDNPKTIVTVGKIEGRWTEVEYGSSGFAKFIGSILERWPISRGYQLRYIRIYQASSSLIEISKAGNPIGFNLSSNLDKTSDLLDMADLDKILKPLRHSVKRNIETWKGIKGQP